MESLRVSMQRAGSDQRPIFVLRKSDFRLVTKCGSVEGGEDGRMSCAHVFTRVRTCANVDALFEYVPSAATRRRGHKNLNSCTRKQS